MHDEMRRPALALAAALALVVLVAVVALLASGQPERPPLAVSPTPTPSSVPSATPTASPSPAAVLDDRFGFVFWEGVSGRVDHAITEIRGLAHALRRHGERTT